jgi:DNA repair exonuclease SbcCD nuclease subunit
MKILIIGDPHISHKRIERSQDFLTELSSIINASNADLTVILGDVFDEHEWVHVACSTMWNNFLLSVDKSKKIIHLLGNHEMVNAQDFPAKYHALHAYDHGGNYQIIDTPKVINNMGFVPFVPTGKFSTAISGMNCSLLFCHQEFTGSVSPTQGDALPENFQIISGHIHEQMTLGNVWYPGSPLQHSFGEEGDKFIHLIETDQSGYRVVQKIQLNLKSFQSIDVAWDDTEMPLGIDTDRAYYRFVVTGKRTEIAIFKANELYKNLMVIGKVKLNVLPETKPEKQRTGVTFRSALAELLKDEDLKEIASEIGA